MKRGGKKFRTTQSPVTADSTYTPIRRGNVLKREEKAESSGKKKKKKPDLRHFGVLGVSVFTNLLAEAQSLVIGPTLLSRV